MHRILTGVYRFQQHSFGHYRKLFAKLARDGQHPHTLFITCADSRVVANVLTQSEPGDLFIVKNVGNIVPPADTTAPSHSIAAAIEYAVLVLGVSDIVVCGHTHCGAMRALLDGVPASDQMPHLREWLALASPVATRIQGVTTDRLTAASQENVLFALENLHTYPCITERLADGRLHLHGWMFAIATAQVFAFDPAARQFAPVVPPS